MRLGPPSQRRSAWVCRPVSGARLDDPAEGPGGPGPAGVPRLATMSGRDGLQASLGPRIGRLQPKRRRAPCSAPGRPGAHHIPEVEARIPAKKSAQAHTEFSPRAAWRAAKAGGRRGEGVAFSAAPEGREGPKRRVSGPSKRAHRPGTWKRRSKRLSPRSCPSDCSDCRPTTVPSSLPVRPKRPSASGFRSAKDFASGCGGPDWTQPAASSWARSDPATRLRASVPTSPSERFHEGSSERQEDL